MNEQMNLTKTQFTDVIVPFLKKEAVLVIAACLAIATSFVATPKMEYIDFKVLVLLFNLMIVVAAFKELQVLDSIATSLLSKCTSYRSICYTLVFITFFSSMLVTNDVALITFVPLTLIIGNKAKIDTLKIIVFETLAANLGSALTPMGNPQNLFIYSFFNITPSEFFKITLPMVILAIVFLIAIMIKGKKDTLAFTISDIKITNKKQVMFYSVLLIIILLSVFHVIDYRIAFLCTLVVVLLINRQLFSNVDYSLLLTFVAFFIFIGNISSMESVKNIMGNILSSGESTYISSILASQAISNVPATMLISGFTPFYKELLMGVNIGGMGTLIASLASVISYKLYTKENPEKGIEYLKSFTVYNVIGLAVFIPVMYFLI